MLFLNTIKSSLSQYSSYFTPLLPSQWNKLSWKTLSIFGILAGLSAVSLYFIRSRFSAKNTNDLFSTDLKTSNIIVNREDQIIKFRNCIQDTLLDSQKLGSGVDNENSFYAAFVQALNPLGIQVSIDTLENEVLSQLKQCNMEWEDFSSRRSPNTAGLFLCKKYNVSLKMLNLKDLSKPKIESETVKIHQIKENDVSSDPAQQTCILACYEDYFEPILNI